MKRVTDVPLTYAANWTDYRRVPFWYDLDAIGIQAYFPLSESHDPDAAELRAAWRRLMAELRSYADELNRDIVFTELGYNRSWAAAREPWEAHTDGVEASDLQRRCLEIALEAIRDEPRVVGAFLWKWFPRPRDVGEDFQLAEPETKALLRRVWLPSDDASP